MPGVIGALLTSLPGLFEAAFLKEAGAEALAAAALVYPLVILSGMFSAGAFGGAVSGFIARAIGSGDAEEASGVLVCAGHEQHKSQARDIEQTHARAAWALRPHGRARTRATAFLSIFSTPT